MAIAAIVINQQGKSQGSPGLSRSDLSAGATVMLTNHDNNGVESWTWELLSIPLGSKAALRGAMNPIATFMPDVSGSYEIRLTIDGGAFDRRIAAVGTNFLGIRKPVPQDGSDPFNARWAALNEAFDLIDADAANSLKKDGSNAPSSDISWDGHRITHLGGLEVEGVIRLGKASDPEAVVGKGFLYLRDIGNSTDLFYCGADGALVRLTKEGRLNVPAAFDDRIRLNADDKDPGYLGTKFEVAPGLSKEIANGILKLAPRFGTESGTICAGDDSRLSDTKVAKPHGREHQFEGKDEIAVREPTANAIPMANENGRLDSWISEATKESRGVVRIGGDLSGSANELRVMGLCGLPLPNGAKDGFLRWNADGTALEVVPYGANDQTICCGDDARLSDPRLPLGNAGGQLTGLFPNPSVIGITDQTNRSLKIGNIPDGSLLTCRNGKIDGINPSSRRTIVMALNEHVETSEEIPIGCFILDGDEDTAPMSFLTISRVTRNGLSGFVRLYNATDNILVTDIKVQETASAGRRKSGLHLPAGKKLYEVRVSLTNGSKSGDRLICMWAGLIADQHV
jgi:hypothetical protein